MKHGYNDEYPNKSYGEAFDEFFEDPKWEYFVSEDDEDIVEFTGKCFWGRKSRCMYTVYA